MAFASFASIEDVVIRYSIEFRRERFVVPLKVFPSIGEYYLTERDFTLREVPFQRSEAAICETLIYPTLREAWRHYRQELTLLSHEPMSVDEELRGEVDYVICRRSKLGPLVPDLPYVLVGEAKRDEMGRGWGQALAGMVAAQKLDGLGGRTFYGISTNGLSWAFGKLIGCTFTQDPKTYDIEDSNDLFGALHSILTACRDQLLATSAVLAGAGDRTTT